VHHDAWKTERLRGLQSQAISLLPVAVGERVVAGQHQIGGQHLSGLQFHGAVHPVGEKFHRGDGGDRQHQRNREQPQFTVA